MAGEPRFRRVAIVGLGLMGGSLARALRRLPDAPEIAASSGHGEDLERALVEGVIQRGTRDPADAVLDADLVVYATPPDATLRLLDAHAERLTSSDAVVTDVVSVKRAVVERARAVGLADRFVGSHPMAGGHGSGYGASRADLYDGARVWLCPAHVDTASEAEPLDAVDRVWRAIGAEPRVIEAEAHDRTVAWASHLPQVVSSALAAALAEGGTPPDALGPGGRDTTRLAASRSALWTEILRTNADLLVEPLDAVRRSLETVAAALEAGDDEALRRWLAAGRRWREGAP